MSMHDETVEIVRVPIFLDDHDENTVAVVLINREHLEHFSSGAPIKTHLTRCPIHGRELDHYSISSVNNGRVKIKIGKPTT